MEGAGAAVFAAARDIAGGLGLSSRARNSFTTTPVGQDPCVLPFTYIAATAVTNLKIPARGTGTRPLQDGLMVHTQITDTILCKNPGKSLDKPGACRYNKRWISLSAAARGGGARALLFLQKRCKIRPAHPANAELMRMLRRWPRTIPAALPVEHTVLHFPNTVNRRCIQGIWNGTFIS